MKQTLLNPSELLVRNELSQFVLVQGSTSGLIGTINAEQWLTIRGKSFRSEYFWRQGNEVAAGLIVDFMIQISDDCEFSGIVGTDGDTEIDFFVNTTFSAPGTLQNVYNMNMLSPNISTTITSISPTIIDDGQLISSRMIPGDIFGGGGSAGSSSQDGYVVAGGTILLIRISNTGSNPMKVHVQTMFSE